MTVNIKVTRPVEHKTDRLAYFLHDWESPKYFSDAYHRSVPRSLVDPNDKLKDDSGYPEMVPMEPRVGVKLTEPLQWFMMKQLVLSKYGINLIESDIGGTNTFKSQFYKFLDVKQRNYMVNAFLGLTKSWTAFMNGAGTELESGRRNYITEWNLDSKEYPMLFENSCGGNTHELASLGLYSKGYKIKMLRVADYPLWRNYNYITHPQFFVKATNSTVIRFGSNWRVDPFHYLDGRDVIVPLFCNENFVYVDADRVQLLKGKPIPNVYFPPQ